MRLLIAVVQRQDANELVESLTARGFGVTRISSEGGFLREGNITLFVAIPADEIDRTLQTIRDHCRTRVRYVSPLPPVAESGEFYPPSPIEVQVGGATVFVLRVNQHLRL